MDVEDVIARGIETFLPLMPGVRLVGAGRRFEGVREPGWVGARLPCRGQEAPQRALRDSVPPPAGGVNYRCGPLFSACLKRDVDVRSLSIPEHGQADDVTHAMLVESSEQTRHAIDFCSIDGKDDVSRDDRPV